MLAGLPLRRYITFDRKGRGWGNGERAGATAPDFATLCSCGHDSCSSWIACFATTECIAIPSPRRLLLFCAVGLRPRLPLSQAREFGGGLDFSYFPDRSDLAGTRGNCRCGRAHIGITDRWEA